ncbi:MAG TPA: RodZ domain-containing protein [Burkholderiaceae bacterium]|jgi:cytoskeleton protein RodZ|nr:RodZ domain-containing protein [Burkholderiaceae bacterium]
MSEAASNDVPDPELTPEVVPLTVTLGARLAAERELKAWTIEHVASQLNLAPRQIQALETDNYAALPGMASVRGFVRAYAKLLKIDATSLVAMISSEQITPTQPLEPKRHLAAAPFSDNRLMSAGHRRSSPKTILVAIVVVLLAIGAIAVERMGGWPTLSQSLSTQFKELSAASPSSPAAQPTAGETLNSNAGTATAEPPPEPVASVPAEVSATVSSAAHDESTVSDAVKVEPNPVLPAEKQVSASASVIKTVPVAVAPIKTSVGEKNLLVLKVRKDSWVEVRAGNNALISRLVKAGSTEQVEIAGPATLTLGNAAGVDVIFRGSPLETNADAKNNVVRLSLK